MARRFLKWGAIVSRIVSQSYSNQRTMQRGRSVRGSRARAVGAFVPQIAKKSFQRFGFSTASLLTDWSTIVGQDVAALTQPERLKWPKPARSHDPQGHAEDAGRGATLTIRVDPAHVLEIQYQQKQIKERLNAYFGYAAVAELRWIQVPLGQVADALGPMLHAHTRSSEKKVLGDSQLAKAATGASVDCDQAHTIATETSDRLSKALARLAENVRGESIRKLPIVKELTTL
ncbi:MAG: DUF721 domain-containing protein [Hyphomicrobiaceae bacterium]